MAVFVQIENERCHAFYDIENFGYYIKRGDVPKHFLCLSDS